jgi:plastocyanin
MKKLTLAVAVLALAFGLAACGGDDETTDTAATTDAATMTEETTETTTEASGGGETVAFEADPSGALAYTEDKVNAKAGDATIEFNNPASVAHDVVIEDDGGNEIARTEVITGSSTSTDAKLEKGKFTFYCSVPGHREAGMEGTLTVK